jgi:hypothetical protein
MEEASSPEMLVSIHRCENLNLTHVLQFHVIYYQIIPMAFNPLSFIVVKQLQLFLTSHIVSHH